MNFELTQEQAILRDSVARFSQSTLAENAVERAGSTGFPWDVAQRMAEFGLFGITLSGEDGGARGSLVNAVIAIQAIAAACPRSADVIQAGNFGVIRTFAEYATPEQKARYLPDLLEGRTVMSVGMTEPEAGSAVTDLKTSATAVDGGYRIDGTKIFGTHSTEASVFLVYVRFGPGTKGIGAVLLDREMPGFTLGQASAFMNGESWAQLYFDNCIIPEENVVLGPGGFAKQMSGFNLERIGNAARSVAVGRHAYDVARRYAQDRRQFGRPLCEFQGVQWMFAEVATRLEAAQLLLMKAAVNADNGFPSAQETAMAKLACNEAGHYAADRAVQILGGHGFDCDSIVQYCLRRTRGWMIAGGSTEILKNRIAEAVFERRFSQRPPDTGATQ